MKSRVLRVIFVLVVLLVFLIAIFPWLLSSSPVRNLVVSKATQAAPGELEIGDWRLSWRGGIRVEEVSYQDPGSGVSVTVEQVEVKKGLLALAINHRDLGEITVQGPRVRLEIPESDTGLPSAPQSSSPSEAGAAPTSQLPGPTGKTEPIRLPEMAVDFSLNDGRIEVIAPGQTSTQVVENLNVKLAVTGTSDPITYTVDGQVAGGDGGISVSGTTTLTEDGTLVLGQVATETLLAIADLDLEPLTTWAGLPIVQSRLTLDVKASGSLADGLHVRGNAQLPGLTLSGEALGGDHPSLGDVVVVINATCTDERLGISNLVVRSGVAQLQATGEVGTSADGEFSMDGQVDLAALAKELPHTLHLQEGVALDEGVLALTGNVERNQGITALDVSVSVDALRGRRAGEVIAWDSPTRLAIKGRQGPDLLVLDLCEITSPFLNGRGSGTLDSLSMNVDASLDQAMREVGKFVDLAGWSATGDVSLEVAATKQGDDYTVQCMVASPALSVTRGEKRIAPSERIEISMKGTIRRSAEPGLEILQHPHISWATWMSTGQMTMERVEPSAGRVQGLRTEATLDLEALSTTLGALSLLPEGVSLEGGVQIQVAADLEQDKVDVSSLVVTLQDLVAGTPDGIFREANIRLETTGNIQGKAVTLPSLTVNLGAGSIRLRDTAIADGAIATQASGQLELASLLAALKDFVPLPEGTTVSGASEFAADVALHGKQVALSATAGVSNLVIASAGSEPIREDHVGLAAALSVDGEAGTLSVRQADITSEAVQLQASVETSSTKNARELSASGELGLDLEKVAGYVRALLGIDVQMAGKQTQPFSFASRWQEDDPSGMLKNATFSAGLHADRIEAFGLNIVDLDMPLILQDGQAKLEIKAQVNEGQLVVRPRIDFTQEPAVASLVDPTNLLTNVQLTDQLSEELLSNIHPVFKGASEVTGLLSMGMEEFVWPLAPEARPQARFNGWMQFAGLQMKTHGMLEKILAAMKVRERDADFGDRDLTFRCENERITCSPLKFRVEKYEVAIVGSMGFDQSLDYVAQIPVTESLVGRDGFKYLEGTTIRVPIRGSSARPELNAGVFTEAVRDLAKQAAKKAITENAGRLLEGLLGP